MVSNEQLTQRLPKFSLFSVVGDPWSHRSQDSADGVRHTAACEAVELLASHEEEVGEVLLEDLAASRRLEVGVEGGVSQDVVRDAIAERG